jgi:hypothetical protein
MHYVSTLFRREVPNKNTFRICDERAIGNNIIDANGNRGTLSIHKAANFEQRRNATEAIPRALITPAVFQFITK